MASPGAWSSYTDSLNGHRIASRIVLASENPPGLRLTSVLSRAADWSVVADLSAALFAMRRLLCTAEMLQKATGTESFTIAADRVIVTPRGALLFVEPEADIWELRAPGADGARIDISEIVIAVVSLM